MQHLSSLSDNRIATVGAAAAGPVAILVNPLIYQALSVCFGLLGVFVARAIFIDQENKRLGRKQRFRETLPLTLAAALIVGPLLIDHQMSLSVSAMIGLATGYSTILIIKAVVKIWLGVLRAGGKTIADQILASLGSTPLPADDDKEIDKQLDRLDGKDDQR